MWLRLMVTFTCLFLSTPSFAHSADQHVLGTIMAIDATHVEIKTTKGQLIQVQVNKKTRYKDQSNPKTATMPKVGDRVVITAEKGTKKGDKALLATDVHFSSAKHAPSPTPSVPVPAP